MYLWSSPPSYSESASSIVPSAFRLVFFLLAVGVGNASGSSRSRGLFKLLEAAKGLESKSLLPSSSCE